MGVAIMGAIVAAEVGDVPTPDAFMRGFERALLVAAGIAIAGAIVAYVLIRPHEEAGRRTEQADRRARRQVAPARSCRRTENAPGCGSGRFPFRGGEPVNRGSAAQPRSSAARRPIRRWCLRIRSGVRSSAVWA